MKNIKKRKVKLGHQPFYAAKKNHVATWYVNEYYYDEEGAEI
tara:strand:- start:3920 stop:4045 length:126 start_codon:yes stop_codon:yes gene_type:complete